MLMLCRNENPDFFNLIKIVESVTRQSDSTIRSMDVLD